jgi:hypothetical protein
MLKCLLELEGLKQLLLLNFLLEDHVKALGPTLVNHVLPLGIVKGSAFRVEVRLKERVEDLRR